MKVIEAEKVYELLSAADCIEIMRETLMKLSRGESLQYLRTAIKLPNGNMLGLMPAYLDDDYFGTKVLTIYHTNTGTGYPSHQGSVLIFDSKYGALRASVDATAITQVRTGAVSAVATDMLAKKDAKTLALLGSGAQARSHAEAISKVRKLVGVTVWDINRDFAKGFAKTMEAKLGIPIKVCETAEEAVRGADIVCTVTASTEPILKGKWLKKGAHVNAVGACTAKDREVDSETVVRAKLYCDSMESILNEGGDFLIPKSEGLVNDSHIVGSLGDTLLGKCQGRTSEDEITMFEALGLAIEDIAAAKYVFLKE